VGSTETTRKQRNETKVLDKNRREIRRKPEEEKKGM
jgi:hypothetical protein